ncbi:MAG TPA: GDYXXLXY domain-containing protein [Bacillota bacterium]|nr:GDYXXLXY domain-containing protein [Bacillota bacterium]
MKPKLLLLIAILGLQTAWILGTTFVQERALAQGQCILLETQPVDPRDLLRGDYVILNYKISDVPLTEFSPSLAAPPPAGSTVYVALTPRKDFYTVVRASAEKITPREGEVVLKGRTQTWWAGPPQSGAQPTIHVNYGLEQYYVREGTGNPRGKLTVQVAVPASGQGRIKQVLLDGKPYAEAMKASARRD